MKCRKCGGTKAGPVCLLCEMFEAALPPGGTPTSGWPIASKALAVHPKQVAKANARAKAHGINVIYDAKGTCHIPDRGERRKLLRLEGMHDNDSFTGD